MNKPNELSLDLLLDPRIPEDQAARIPEDSVRAVVERLLRSEGLARAVELSIVFTDDESIRQLNAAYRQVDETTDVLSFPFALAEGGPEFKTAPGHPLYLGDVVVSFPRAESQAAEYGHSLEREICYLVAHGTLHLLGYEHRDAEGQALMRAKEEAALHDMPRSALGDVAASRQDRSDER